MKDRWVLKSPFHLAAIDHLFEVYPDARIIHTHRDPAQAVPSTASMIHTLRAVCSDSLEPATIGRQVMDIWTLALQRATESRRRHKDKEDQFFDAHFDDTLKDPVALLRHAYKRFEIPYTEETRARMTAFLSDNPRGNRGAHNYALKDFGIELGQICERFDDYCRMFDVPLAG